MTDYHEFTLIIRGYDELDDRLANALLEAGCDDATLSQSNGILRLDFDRRGQTRLAAIRSAIADVENCGLGLAVKLVEG